MNIKASLITSALVGIIFGITANHPILLGSWWNLVIWGVIGLLIGFFIEERRYIRSAGISYGFFLTVSFLMSGFQGTSDKIPAFALLALVLSIVGAMCGWCLVYLGNYAKRKSAPFFS